MSKKFGKKEKEITIYYPTAIKDIDFGEEFDVIAAQKFGEKIMDEEEFMNRAKKQTDGWKEYLEKLKKEEEMMPSTIKKIKDMIGLLSRAECDVVAELALKQKSILETREREIVYKDLHTTNV